MIPLRFWFGETGGVGLLTKKEETEKGGGFVVLFW